MKAGPCCDPPAPNRPTAASAERSASATAPRLHESGETMPPPGCIDLDRSRRLCSGTLSSPCPFSLCPSSVSLLSAGRLSVGLWRRRLLRLWLLRLWLLGGRLPKDHLPGDRLPGTHRPCTHRPCTHLPYTRRPCTHLPGASPLRCRGSITRPPFAGRPPRRMAERLERHEPSANLSEKPWPQDGRRTR